MTFDDINGIGFGDGGRKFFVADGDDTFYEFDSVA
jgi:hypothetical protein